MAFETKSAEHVSQLRCEKCSKAFPNQRQLAVHQLKEGHLVCGVCDQSFHNIQSVSAHRAQAHRHSPNIVCPGCSSAFSTAGLWLQHIERARCTSLFPSDVHRKAAGIVRQVNKEWIEEFDSQNASVHVTGDSHIQDSWAAEADTPRFSVQEKPNDFPQLSEQASDRSNLAANRANHLAQPIGNAWTQRNLFPEKQEYTTAPPLASAKENLALTPRPSGERVIDPNSPGFNAAVFYNPILEVYTCPHNTCNNKSKTVGALVYHLKSPKHTGEKFKCPSCLAVFTSTSAWLQHAETVDLSRCVARESKNFARIVHEMTNGALNIEHVEQIFGGQVEVKLSDDWDTPRQMPVSSQSAQPRQPQEPGFSSGARRDPSTVRSSWSGLMTK
ncbi:hypothetical protein GGR52DRAFT_473644 [Hypoxylon sp. FL1284]|nr:hypothetical protein GGR52DRAFT_473644 [Hypoxylon sp. FL1284]